MKDEQGRLLLVNRHLEHLLGRPRQELIGKSSAELWPPEVAVQHETVDRQVLERGEPVTAEEVAPAEDGTHTFLSVKFPLPRVGGEGATMGGISTDITELKEAGQAQALLIEVGVVLAQSLDMDTTLRNLASLAVKHLADYCMVDLLGGDGQLHRLVVLARDPARDAIIQRAMPYAPRLGTQSPAARVFETGQPEMTEITPEWLGKAALSEEHLAVLEELGPRSAVILPLKARGRTLGVINLASAEPGRMTRPSVVAVAQGVVDRAAIAIDNARLYQEAREAVRVREDVVAIVSHDLRNPLNAISLSASALIKREELDERTAKAAMRIYAAADRAHRLIRDLLDFTQARVGGIPVSLRAVAPGELARQVVEEIQSAYPERRLELRVEVEGKISADPDRLAQVMANLMGNAVQHSPGGTPVRVRVRGEGEGVLFEVHNQGMPIPAEQLPGLFEPFQRGREAGAGSGGSLGLGLFISRQIVEAHGGRIDARSALGEGTAFTVWLPRRREALTPGPPPPPSIPTRPPAGRNALLRDAREKSRPGRPCGAAPAPGDADPIRWESPADRRVRADRRAPEGSRDHRRPPRWHRRAPARVAPECRPPAPRGRSKSRGAPCAEPPGRPVPDGARWPRPHGRSG